MQYRLRPDWLHKNADSLLLQVPIVHAAALVMQELECHRFRILLQVAQDRILHFRAQHRFPFRFLLE